MLASKEMNKLNNLIKDSFRVRPNHDTIYIDVGGHLERFKSEQHQLVFGRRGSGKSSLLIHFKNKVAYGQYTYPIYIQSDDFKRLVYPDLLIRLLLAVFESMPTANKFWQRSIFKNDLQKQIENLRDLLKKAPDSKIIEKEDYSYGGKTDTTYGVISVTGHSNVSKGRETEFREHKLDALERNFSDYKNILVKRLKKSTYNNAFVLVDDFYLLNRNIQPDVIDYLHRMFRGTDFYLKISTVRHRTTEIRHDNQTIGVKLNQDVEELNLDRTLEDLESTSDYLTQMLESMASSVGIDNAVSKLFNQNAFESLVLASGGVPRDFLNTFVEAVNSSVSSGKTKWLTPTHVYKGASRLSYRTKLSNLRSDTFNEATEIERLFRSLISFCLIEKKKTAFLISQSESQEFPSIHELILQLMDFKLVHVIEPDTSAAAGRKGRYEAYTLDFSLFMEPRKRNIDIIEFWKYDDRGRRIGVREAPVFSLERAKQDITNDDQAETEVLIETIE